MIVIWFGGDCAGVCAALRLPFRSQPVGEVTVSWPDRDVWHAPFEGSLDAALDQFARGTVPSIGVRGDSHPQLSGDIFCPRFGRGVREEWTGCVEGDDDHLFDAALTDDLTAIDGLTFFGRFTSDWLADEVPRITVETFIWDDDWLIVGGVRQDDGRWLVRRGPKADRWDSPAQR